jgi:hypothetical protein
MADFEQKKFKNQAVLLDGNSYKTCEFKNCTLVFNGIAAPSLAGNTIDACNWRLDGPAANTLTFLAALYQMGPEMQELVEQTFNTMRGRGNEGITVH